MTLPYVQTIRMSFQDFIYSLWSSSGIDKTDTFVIILPFFFRFCWVTRHGFGRIVFFLCNTHQFFLVFENQVGLQIFFILTRRFLSFWLCFDLFFFKVFSNLLTFSPTFFLSMSEFVLFLVFSSSTFSLLEGRIPYFQAERRLLSQTSFSVFIFFELRVYVIC